MNFKNSTIYQIYPKSFYDTTGSGEGDINGITAQLDYLAYLGIDYIWSTPFFTSPQKDNGYDVADYYSIDPRFGTMADVERLIAEAAQRGIGLMFDMVFNHTSTEHEWFQKALAGDPKYLDYYIFKEGRAPGEPPTNWQSKFGGSAWQYVPHLDRWYLHLFDESQADLNWDNPQVREELKSVLRFWRDKGVKGFRFDVVNLVSKPALFEDDFIGDGRRFYTDGPHVHEYLQELVQDSGIDDMVTVGEMSSTSLANCVRYTQPERHELRMVFNFHHLKVDYAEGNKWALQPFDFQQLTGLLHEWQVGMQAADGWSAVFWCNHDQPRAVSRFGDTERYWYASATMLATAIHLLRGTPYVYQGEEIGMTNAGYTDIAQYKDVESHNYYRILCEQGARAAEALAVLAERSRDNSRTPMQWSDAVHAGFTTGTPWLAPPANYSVINVAAQLQDDRSVLAYYRQLIALRKQCPVIAEGQYAPLLQGHERVFAYQRFTASETLYAFHNFYGDPVTITVDTAECHVLLSNYDTWHMTATQITLEPYQSLVLRKSCGAEH